ncbi:sensory box histidine kinase/response regulator [Legionella donaldsonii]|uniref:Sensory box histidine kinase/response regulator n=1 Tax=Legionella donaldsonii TaxID=45060 RepID=A0A378JAY1_9GAMM|nr:response regulator [Legionella donaldsonii]STX44298.1 sensory box histidine kinase/response regulator [Legionella donaldsonii]
MVYQDKGIAKPQLLIIEDNPVCQRIYLAILGRYYQIASAGNAAEALQCLSKQAYDCIILDLGLPDKPGIDVLSFIRNDELNKDTPIIIISAHMSDDIQQTCLHLGANAIYTKPIGSGLLRSVIENFLGS